uniref:Spermatogenesis-defective protein 39 homolog n=1 Tax=Erpetoichthys calabaricus TaxID=27687 RepID=A0A8C4TLX0_ERPCA
MIRGKGDEEDYWNSSKFKAFTFDDDDEFSQLKESKKAVNSIQTLVDDDDDDDEDDVEKVGWNGEPVGSISLSIKETASRNRMSATDQELGFPKIETTMQNLSLSKQGSNYSLSSLFKGDYIHIYLCQYYCECVGEIPSRHFAPELRKPKSHFFLFFVMQTYTLEDFRALRDKMLLLDEAVQLHNGNVITAVKILFRELESRQVALRHFIHYLKEMEELKLLNELLKYAVFSLPFSAEDAGFVQDHYTLLERQIIIEKTGQVEVFKKNPRKAAILDMPIITTLYYSCFYHYGESEGTYSSPGSIKKTFKLSDKQYLLTALGARAKLKAWKDVDSLFVTKNWLGYTQKKAPIGFHKVVDILHKNNAPDTVIQEYICLVDDTDLKLNLAMKYKCHDIIINVSTDFGCFMCVCECAEVIKII